MEAADSRPRLPERRRREDQNRGKDTNDLQQLQQQLVNNAAFRQLLEQPDRLAAVLHADPVLQQAAASSPEISQLLDPATMQQALELLLQGGSSSAGAAAVPPIQRKALMQLQNYALQLQQARITGNDVRQQQDATLPWLAAAGGNFAQQQQQQQQDHNSNTSSPEGLWMALQQRLQKYQHRAQVLAAGKAGTCALEQQQQQAWPATDGPHPQHQQQLAGSIAASGHSAIVGAVPAETVSARACREPRTSDGSRTMHELMMAFPDVLHACGGPTSGSHATIGLLSAVAEQPPVEAAAAEASSIKPQQLQLQLQPSEPCALPFSPNWQQEQQQEQQLPAPSLAGLMLWPQSSNDPAFVAAAAAAAAAAAGTASAAVYGVSEGSSRPLSALRSGSALGHRILRPHSSEPIPLESGSTPLGIEQLGSGEVIVDITPPTKITKELSWSVDPGADYVLDASASGSFSPLPLASVGAPALDVRPAGGSSGAASWGASLDSLVALAGGSSSGSGMVHSISAGNHHGLHSAADNPDCAFPGRERRSSTAGSTVGSTAAGVLPMSAAVPAGHMLGLQSGVAAGGTAGLGARRVSSSSTGSAGGSSNKLKAPVPRPKQATNAAVPTAAAAAATTQSKGAAQSAAFQQYQQHHQQQPQQQQHLQQQQQQVLPVSTSSWYGSGAATDTSAAYQACPAHQDYGYDSKAQPVAWGAGYPGSSFKGLHPKSYYEDVAPSSWRPGDTGEVQGDYLDLYRRAYCSYADAIFPPLWLSLICVLVSSRIMPLWQLLLLGGASFWGGLYVMAVKWAGVPTRRLSLSRAVPMFVVSLELLCTGAFILYVLPVMWLGHSLKCAVVLCASVAMLCLHATAHWQDPGYTPIPDAEEGPYARRLSAPSDTNTTGPAAATAGSAGSSQAGLPQPAGKPQPFEVDLDCRPAAAGTEAKGKQQQQQQRRLQQQSAPKLAGRALNSCWTCGVERNLRSKHCPICKRCVERFDHHCPVIGNCVGAGNHRAFVGYLMAIVLCQLLFCNLMGSMFVQQHVAQLAASPSGSATSWQRPVAVTGLASASVAGQTGVDSGQTVGQVHQMAGQAWVPGEIELGKPVVAVPAANEDAAVAAAGASASGAVAGSGSAVSSTEAAAAAAGVVEAAGAVAPAVGTAAVGAGRKLADTVLGGEAASAAAETSFSSTAGAASVLNGTTTEASAAAADSQVGGTGATTAAAAAAAGAATSRDVAALSIADAGAAAESAAGPLTASAGSDASSRAAELELLMHSAGWGVQGWFLTAKALWTAAATSPGLLLLLLFQLPSLFISCHLLVRALALAAANLTVNEWVNRHRYLYLQHHAVGFCNRFDRGPAHNCWEFWFAPPVVDWWKCWQQGEEELLSYGRTVLTAHSASALIRWWDLYWAKYQQKLMAAREQRKELVMRRKMAALGLDWNEDG